MARGVKKKEHENLTPSNVRKVASLLEAEKPITKKEACEILNISYNTKRLAAIIEQQKARDESQDKLRKQKRGTPVTEEETKTIVRDYLIDSDPLSEISSRLARPTSLIKKTLKDVGVPEKPTGDDKQKPALLPEQCVKEDFAEGEIVWSSIHHGPATIRAKLDSESYVSKYGAPVYRIWVHEPTDFDDNKQYYAFAKVGGFNAYVCEYDIGSLQHIRDLGIEVS